MKVNPIKKILLASLLCLACCGQLFAQKFEELAQTPPMGWNSWNTFQTNIDLPLLKGMVDTYVSSGMKDAGYTYFVLDDGWMAMQRDKDGNLVADPKKFPNGMKEFADYVHAKGLKFGIYNCAGTLTCAGYPGTRGYEYQDARLYASWGVDYLKFDWCNTDGINAVEAYKTMSKAIRAAGRPMIFSLCEWGQHKPWRWAKDVGQLWRSTGDIGAGFEKNISKGGWTALSVLSILDQQDSIRQYAGPGHWNDPDMLEVGNGMKYNEDKAHFSLWCMLAAPLMAGNDLRKMSDQTRAILTNKELIALDQDPLGVEAFRFYAFDGIEIWVKPLANNELGVCFLNRSGKPQKVSYDWKDHVINDALSNTGFDFNQTTYKLRDLWEKKDIGTTTKPFSQVIPADDVVVLRLTK
ncbi:glycoside hydrolase family 27 protein [Mucilaginibacter gotjawali]|uniref:Alpha-galactosidase n=2 Tax=Mucilaginibacter gotjawali TaxID=1550579 RepID=A0A839SLS8_9SPHI|nr:glycoside hydrolase family 27 protein [Mucilaginibacter gotjawali]MBB3057397.1 alpha-galactosidase [Mucilaginibacter gotjawali]BAU55484.1 Alpha-galactosidase A precursor [Mucilaginibacter gotjawali]